MRYTSETKDDFIAAVQKEVMTSSEVIEFLGVTRQTLGSLVKRGKLTPIKEINRDRLFLREDVESRKEASQILHEKYRPYDE
ncbi:helix-turn-helix domain-containing protein [Ornithinibacillus xuwenensis]|uniref:Helix-turn-helix domain-containing protein n=1 Tax=Ornithinibacillus xuwenensis TaxID=3144668 RepID=A0ABU9XG53_9BACI